jgi:hypothetical protein
MTVYAVEKSEPVTQRFEDGLQAGISEVFFTRETAAAEYNDVFPDYQVPAFVVEILAR